MGACSLDLELFAYVFADSYEAYLPIAEALLLKCMKVVEGAGFAFPFQTNYLVKDIYDESKNTP
jgi:MscS family membrane protein